MRSILAQSFENWELVVCDSFSDDGTWEYFQEFKGDPRVRLFQIPKDGLYPGWNQCLLRVRGQYCYFATSDDTMAPDFLAKMYPLLEKNPSVRVATCNFDFIDSHDKVIPPSQGVASSFFGEWREVLHRRSGLLDFLVHTELSVVSWTTMTAMLFNRTLLDDVGGFRVDASYFADRFWAISAALHSDTIHCPERLATWRIHDKQASSFAENGWRQRNLELTRETLVNLWPLVTERFGDHKNLFDDLLAGVSLVYEEGFCLDRGHLRHSPSKFFSGVIRAAIDDRDYLWRRIKQGFRWDESIESFTMRLIIDLQIPWPPTALKAEPENKKNEGFE